MSEKSPSKSAQRYVGFEILLLFVHRESVTRLLFSGLIASLVLLADQYWLIHITRYLGTYVSLAVHAASGLVAVLFIRNTISARIHSLSLASESAHAPEKLISRIAVLMFASFLLIIPGVLTDIAGLLLTIPPFRTVACYLFSRSHASEIQKTKEHLHLVNVSEQFPKS